MVFRRHIWKRWSPPPPPPDALASDRELLFVGYEEHQIANLLIDDPPEYERLRQG